MCYGGVAHVSKWRVVLRSHDTTHYKLRTTTLFIDLVIGSVPGQDVSWPGYIQVLYGASKHISHHVLDMSYLRSRLFLKHMVIFNTAFVSKSFYLIKELHGFWSIL